MNHRATHARPNAVTASPDALRPWPACWRRAVSPPSPGPPAPRHLCPALPGRRPRRDAAAEPPQGTAAGAGARRGRRHRCGHAGRRRVIERGPGPSRRCPRPDRRRAARRHVRHRAGGADARGAGRAPAVDRQGGRFRTSASPRGRPVTGSIQTTSTTNSPTTSRRNVACWSPAPRGTDRVPPPTRRGTTPRRRRTSPPTSTSSSGRRCRSRLPARGMRRCPAPASISRRRLPS